MQVGEQHLVFAHPVVLLGHRFLDLEDQVAGLPHVVRGGQDGGARGDEVLVRDGGPGSRVTLDEYLVAAPGQLKDTGRSDRHPVFVILDLFGNAYPHAASLSL